MPTVADILSKRDARSLASLSPTATVRDALLDNAGPLAPLLAVAKACESGDDSLFAQHADALNLTSRQVNLAHLEALTWADNLDQN